MFQCISSYFGALDSEGQCQKIYLLFQMYFPWLNDRPEKVNDRATAVIKRQLHAKQKQLKTLLKQSLRVQGFSYKYPSLNSNISTSAGSFQSAQTAIETLKSASDEKEKKRKRTSKPMRMRKKKKLTTAIERTSDDC